MTQIPTWNGSHPSSGPGPAPGGRAAPGTLIGGRYLLRAAVGHGGMGTVWRAADTLLRRAVAVKEVVLPPGLAPSDRDGMYERTLREARAAAALSHPAVVQVYDVVTEAGRPWIVMELLDARSLADIVLEDGPLHPRAVAKIGIALLGALEVAHAAGVLHRDVKPANVLISSDGRCVLTDFGVARMPTDVQLTTPGMVLGSPHFISPERAMGGPFGPPSDLFSLGVSLYTAVEGRPPFDKGDPIETMHAVVEDPPAPPARAGVLGGVLYGLLEKDPHRRWDVPTARSALRELLAGPLASTAPPHQMTDPYAVVPAQRTVGATARAAAQPALPAPSGQIGGRAMLAPGESLTDRLAALRQPAAARPVAAPPGPAAPASAAVAAPTGPMTAVPPRRPGMGPPAAAPAGPGGTAASATETTGVLPAAETTAFRASGDTTGALPAAAYPAGGWSRPSGAPGPGAYPGGHPGAYPGVGPGTALGAAPAAPATRPSGADRLGPAVAAARRVAARWAGTVRGWSRSTRLAAAAGVSAALVLGLVGVANLVGGDRPAGHAAAAPTPAPAPTGPDFPVQRFSDRGVTVNVPRGWRRAAGGVFVDFTDPRDPGRRVRILSEPSRAESTRFMEIAESGLRRAKTCARPYARVQLRTGVTLVDRPAAELEYTCGAGDRMRHGVWRAVVSNGRAYSFYLTTPEHRFDESRGIFEEMVRSFALTGAG